MSDHAALVGIENTEEFTFRSMFMAEAASADPSMQFQSEWQTFDLLTRSAVGLTLVEFKYYVLRCKRTEDGAQCGFKGGAGPKNEREFWRCVEKLAGTSLARNAPRYLVLVYSSQYDRKSQYSFDASYRTIPRHDAVSRFWSLTHDGLEARILEIASAQT